MFTKCKFIAALFVVLALFSLRLNAQTSEKDVPRIISYQGQLTTANGSAMNGTHKISATLYSDPHGKNSVWKGSYSSEITNGLFTVLLGSGAQKLPDNSAMNRLLWIGITIDEGEEMQPLIQLAASPYALNVPDQSITMAKLAPDVVLGTMNPPKIQSVVDNSCGGNTSTGTYAMVVGGCTNTASGDESFIGGGSSNTATGQWSVLAGGYSNAALNDYSFVGGGQFDTVTGEWATVTGGYGNKATGDNDFVGGGGGNIEAGTGSVIVGGNTNIDTGLYSSMIGGVYNLIQRYNYFATICGGDTNQILYPADHAFIGGGGINVIQGTNPLSIIPYSSDYSVIAGGHYNTINGDLSAIPGGRNLTIGTSSFGFNAGAFLTNVSTDTNIAYFGDVDLWIGNDHNTAKNLKFLTPSANGHFTSFKAQNQSFDIQYILPAAQGAASSALTNDGSGTLSWGPGSANDWYITGNSNTDPSSGNFLGTINQKDFEIHVYDSYGTANQGTGRALRIEYNTGAGSSPNIIGGYKGNSITNVTLGGSFIGGGGSNGKINTIASDFNVIVGGENNKISVPGGMLVPADHSFIGGGLTNEILGDAANFAGFGVICGGTLNQIQEIGACIVGGQSNQAIEDFAFVGGGSGNTSENVFSTVVAGQHNIANGHHSFIGGGKNNFTQQTSVVDFQAIVGGEENDAEGDHAFIGGGGGSTSTLGNLASGDFSAVVGGNTNKATITNSFIGGGTGNTAQTNMFTTVAGGSGNTASGYASNIPGGDGLIANGRGQTVIGTFNIAKPSSPSGTFSTSDPAFIVGGGGTDNSNPFNAFEVYPNGHSVVYQNNGSGATTANIVGATYNDNTLNAWAHWKWDNSLMVPAGSVVSDHGVSQIVAKIPGVTTGKYMVTLKITRPDGTTVSSTHPPQDLCVTVTACDDGNEVQSCALPLVILPSPLTDTYEIDMTVATSCLTIDHSFMMHVTGRY